MTKNVVSVCPLDSLNDVKDILFEKHIHHVPVIDENRKLVGIITSYDMMKYNLKFDEYADVLVEDVMSSKVVTLEPDDKIGAAAQVFLRHLFHGLPIVNGDKELVGIITTHDILRVDFDEAYPGDELEKAYRASGK